MDECIKKKDIEQKIQDGLNNLALGHDAIEALGMIYEMPAADVAPVRHARWDENGRCSNCGGHAPFWCMASTYYESPWCQECGAKMDGGEPDA